jgi:hypothetical protein
MPTSCEELFIRCARLRDDCVGPVWVAEGARIEVAPSDDLGAHGLRRWRRPRSRLRVVGNRNGISRGTFRRARRRPRPKGNAACSAADLHWLSIRGRAHAQVLGAVRGPAPRNDTSD